jgi:competence protein ComEC
MYNLSMPLPLLWVSLSFVAGILLAYLVALPAYVWACLALPALIGLIVVGRIPGHQRTLRLGGINVNLPPHGGLLVLACLSSVLVGAARYQSSVPAQATNQIAWFNDRSYDLMVTGTLVEPPDVRDTYTNLRLQTQQVDTGKDQFKVSGLLLARVDANHDYHYGDTLRLRGRLETPPANEDFSYRDYLARQGIYSYMSSAEVTTLPGRGGNPVSSAMYALKQVALQNVYRLFLDPEASLLAGILLGVDTGLPARLEQAFNNTGTSHIIAISGFNIAIIAGVFAVLFNRLLGPRRGAIAAVIGIVFYTIFVGGDPTVVRAALMGSVSILAVQVGRRQQGVNTLAFVAALMALWNPFVLWDVGFQLSFFATLGLIVYGTRFMSAAEGLIARHFPASDSQKLASVLGQFVLLTFAAQLTTLPIIAYHFQQISLVSPVANALILPVQPAVMILGGLAVSLSLLVYPLGQLVAWSAWPLTAYTIRVVELFDRVPQAVIYLGGFSLAFVGFFYAALLAVTLAGTHIKEMYSALKQRFRYVTLSTVLLALFICTVFTWRLVAVAPDGRLHLTFLNVGSADAVLIQTPSGRNILINGGPSASLASDALGRRLSPLDHHLDWLVLASTDENQVASLPRLLPRYPPKNVLLGGEAQASFSSGAVMQWLADQTIPVTQAKEGQVLELGQGAELKIANVSPRGATLFVTWNAFHALLPIGENLDTLAQLNNGSALGSVDVLSLAQSGYAPLTTTAWLQNLNPRLVVISVAAGDRDGMPDKAVLDALSGYSVLRTDLNGWIEVISDGKQMWVASERPAIVPTP